MAVFVGFCFDVDPIIYKKSLFYGRIVTLSECKRGCFCITKEAVLECKSGSIANPMMLVWLRYSLHTSFLNRIIGYISACYRCTLKTRKFSTKDFIVR